MKPVLILGGRQHRGCDDLERELHSSGVEVVFRDIDEITISVGPAGVRVQETVDGRDLADFGLLHVLWYQLPMTALLNAIGEYAAARGVLACNVADIGVPTRLLKYVRLANRGLSIPSTVYLPPRLLESSFEDLACQLDLPFVLKSVTGGARLMTSLVTNEDTFANRMRDAGSTRGLLAQELVPPDGSYLLLVLGGDTPVVLQQGAIDVNDVLSSSGWEDAQLVNRDEVDPVAQHAAVRAAAALEYGIAGVHLVRNWTTGQWCVLNVDPNPPITSGRHAADTLTAYSAYLKTRLNRVDQIDGLMSSDIQRGSTNS